MKAFASYGELPELKTDTLRPVGRSYERNIHRVYALVMFPPAAVWFTMTVQRATDQIEYRFAKKDKRTQLALIEAEVKKQIRLETQSVVSYSLRTKRGI
jgi:hypothetical protein